MGGSLTTLDTIQLFALNPNGLAGVIPPGASGTIDVNFTPTLFGRHALTNFTVSLPAATETLNWASIKSDLQPTFATDAAWDVVFSNFVANVGTTVGSLDARLSAEANHLSTITHHPVTFEQLINFELTGADDFGAITTRFRPGALGMGFSDPNDLQARTDADGNVSIGFSGSSLVFQKAANGSFTSPQGDNSVLTKSGDILTLTKSDGSRLVFRADGKLDFRASEDGDRITAAYNAADLLISLTLSATGGVETFTYDASGHITAADGPGTEHTSYTYDAAGHRSRRPRATARRPTLTTPPSAPPRSTRSPPSRIPTARPSRTATTQRAAPAMCKTARGSSTSCTPAWAS